MRKLNYKVGALFITVLIVIYLAAGCGSNNNKESKNSNSLTETVKVTKVKKGSISEEKTYSGTLEGIEQASIVSKIAERVKSINGEVNDYVKAGSVVIQLESNGAGSNYLQTKANYENLKRDYERMKALYNDGAIAKQKLDQTKTALDVARANYQASESTVFLTSPINGIISDLNVDIGDWVTPGMNLATVANVSEMILKFYVTETEVGKIRMGDTVRVYSEYAPSKSVTGRISEISRAATSDSRSFQVKVKFKNTKDKWYKPGMFVSADVVLESHKDVLIVPTTSIIFTNNRNIVFTVDNNIATSVDVQLGLSNEKNTEVAKGLRNGETIVTQGMNNLSDSTEVSILK